MIKQVLILLVFGSISLSFSAHADSKTKLFFSHIKGYKNYKIVAAHFRTDKKEIRYILANPTAYHALKKKMKVMPNGSKIVKIGWSAKELSLFPSALEASDIQRIEYMIRDKAVAKSSDGWTYARVVKKNDKYSSWKGDVNSCVSCHSIAKAQDAVFTKFQPIH